MKKLKSIFKHGEQYSEYKGLKEAVIDYQKPKSNSVSLTEFETTEEEVIRFVNYFIQHGIQNESLKQKMFQNFNDGNFVLDTLPAGENKHVFNLTANHMVVEVVKRAKLGDKLPSGKYVTNLKTIRGIIHEDAHSSSQKFDIRFLNTPESIQKISNKELEKDTTTGEIESKFMEMLFNHFLLTHAKEIEISGNSLDGIVDLEAEVQDLETYDTYDFLERLTSGMKEDRPDYKQSVDHRYIIGTVVSSLLFEDYLKAPQGTLTLFNKYLETQCSMNIDETVQFLTRGKAKNFGQAINQYKQRLKIKSMNNQTPNLE